MAPLRSDLIICRTTTRIIIGDNHHSLSYSEREIKIDLLLNKVFVLGIVIC